MDFGAVKQVSQASGGRSTEIYSQGFAPPEQMSGGQVYPSTDLYALAVTCLILLTGKETQELYDSYSNRWNWRSEMDLSEPLGSVLDKMLSLSPYQRYASANEVLDALPTRPTSSPGTTLQPPTPTHRPTTPTTIQPLARTSSLSTSDLLGISVFTGFESVVLALGLTNWLGVTGLSLGLWGAVMGGLVYAQFRRWIERVDLAIVGGVSLALLLLVPALRGDLPLDTIALLPICVGAALALIMTLIRLMLRILFHQ